MLAHARGLLFRKKGSGSRGGARAQPATCCAAHGICCHRLRTGESSADRERSRNEGAVGAPAARGAIGAIVVLRPGSAHSLPPKLPPVIAPSDDTEFRPTALDTSSCPASAALDTMVARSHGVATSGQTATSHSRTPA